MSEPAAIGEKTKGQQLLAAVQVVKTLDRERNRKGPRPATPEEREILGRFPGFGCLALRIFPNPSTKKYADEDWRRMGEELKARLSEEEYDAARRTVFNAFYTSPTVVRWIYDVLVRLGLPEGAEILEPGCGPGAFIGGAPAGAEVTGVEMDLVTASVAAALWRERATVRCENFRDTKLPVKFDAAVGNVPFADVSYSLGGVKMSLHNYFIAKAASLVKPGGLLGFVTSRWSMDSASAEWRRHMHGVAEFLGAVRLPSSAFKSEGTSVVTDVLFFRRRREPLAAATDGPSWFGTAPIRIGDGSFLVNRHFAVDQPEMVLGRYSRKKTHYATDGFSVEPTGVLADQLAVAGESIVGKAEPRPPREIAVPEPEPEPSVAVTPPSLLPPPEPEPEDEPEPIGEGSFHVDSTGGVKRIENGESVPVRHGSTALHAKGTMMGRRLAALIGLRDLARRVLRSQNEGWSVERRQASRMRLNEAYDAFAKAYGPINKTTHSTAADGTTSRRMPNLVKFREDPDAMLVMAIEDYDEVEDVARKAPIMLRDVVGETPIVERTETAEEALLVCLDRTGRVSLPIIADLCGKSEQDALGELGDLIYLDPATRELVTADVYLSGDVRAKLRVAAAAGPEFERNAEALRGVQPEDILPGDIDANLGAPWIPASDVEAFARELFGTDRGDVVVAHIPREATWIVSAGYRAMQAVTVTADFGTRRVLATSILELCLNQRSPLVYDEVENDKGGYDRVANQEETLKAKEKQGLLKERWKAWVFADPDRARRLVRVYNDTFNNLRHRVYDGSHLRFPGINPSVNLTAHQRNAVWRNLTSGNTLLAHVVGAGKTFVMAATGMKMRQTGMCRKPMFVVPNHMLEQFSREFLHLYPNAKILQATKEDMTRDRRKRLTAKIAAGDWDGIVTTHSSFERIGLSAAYQKGFFRRQIKEYEELLLSAKGERDTPRNVIKALEKQKARREERLRKLMAEEKKDDGLVFDELGVDQLFVDEAHYFKNLETPTKMDRVAGIQTGGSERAFDILMKSSYLAEKRPGHGVTFATGTPISNTMVEMYTMQRFLDPDGLRDRGIDHFDAWAANFGEVVESMEISPDGASLRPRSRFAKFVNLPELQQLFRRFSDVQSAEMLNLPRPKLETGKPIVVSVPMTPHQADLQKTLVARYERIRSTKVDPKEDNALAITTDGRKLALDGRMMSSGAEDCGTNKIAAMTRNVVAVWERTAATRGTQLVFCDMGVHPTDWGFSAYDEVRRKLVEAGVPPVQIANIGDADSDDKKRVLFDKVRSGAVRILLGSTAKMGTGTNVQKRLVALHHLDAPWKPAEVEQREGRILRQGNENPVVAIYRYVTEGSFDAFMWQALETKARFISQVMTGANELRQAQDVGGQELSYAEVKAIASGNPEVLTLAETDAELQRLRISRKNHEDARYLATSMVNWLPSEIADRRKKLDSLRGDQAVFDASPDDLITIGETEHPLDAAWKPLDIELYRIPDGVDVARDFPIGEFRGLPFGLRVGRFRQPEVWLGDRVRLWGAMLKGATGARALLNHLKAISSTYGWKVANEVRDIETAEAKLRDFTTRTDAVWAHEDYHRGLLDLRDRLKDSLSRPNAPDVVPASVVAAEIEALRESQAKAPVDTDRSAASNRNRPIDAIVEMVRRRLPEPIPAPEPMPVPVQAEAAPEPQTVAEPEPVQPPATRPKTRAKKVRQPGANERQGLLFI